MPIIKFYTAVPWESDCMIEYIRSGQQKAYVYSFWIWKWHIDTKDLWNKYKIWSAEWCIIKTGNIVTDFFNTQYCFTSKILISYER